MKEREIITAEDLAPLLQGGWRGTEAAWQALEHCSNLVRIVVGRAYHMNGGQDLRVLEDEGDLLADTLGALVAKVESGGGLPLPKGWDRPDLGPWMAVVVRNQARDVLRKYRIQEREVLSQEGDVTRLRAVQGSDEGDAVAQGGLRHDLEIWHERIRALLERESFPPVQALGWVLLSRPRLLIREWVDRASGLPHQGRQGTWRGLLREPDETWELLCDWLPRHALDPRSDASRLELAWILRSADSTSPQAWRAADPDRAARARDALRKWENRFRPRVRAAIEEERS